jgi:hypothetical protein
MALVRKGKNEKMLKSKASLDSSAKEAMQDMYNYMHAAMLPFALAGSLTKDDFAYFLIINNKVYNIFQIMDLIDNNFDIVSSNL